MVHGRFPEMYTVGGRAGVYPSRRCTGTNGPLFTRASVARMLCRMKTAEPAAEKSSKAKLRNSTVVFLVGNIEPTMAWYERLGFEARYFPPGFAILRRDDVEIFLQHHDGYVRPDDPGAREREAWNVYIETVNVEALFR